MAGPYRESGFVAQLECPRCGKPLHGDRIAACEGNCGVWVTPELVTTAFEPNETRAARIQSWYREQAACPVCSNAMTLCGPDMTLFQGCPDHGYWVDTDAIGQTGLGRLSVEPLVKQARAAARAARETREREEAREREEHEKQARDERERASELARERAERAELDRAERAEREARERAERTKREALVRPQLALLRAAFESNDLLPLAEKLRDLEDQLAALAARVR